MRVEVHPACRVESSRVGMADFFLDSLGQQVWMPIIVPIPFSTYVSKVKGLCSICLPSLIFRLNLIESLPLGCRLLGIQLAMSVSQSVSHVEETRVQLIGTSQSIISYHDSPGTP